MRELIPKKYSPTTGNSSLLGLVFFTIFIIPVFPQESHRLLYNISYTLIFVLAVLSIEQERNTILWIAIVATLTEWIAFYLQMPLLVSISLGVNLIFFTLVVVKMIMQIAGTKEVNVRVIVESINGYLLLGIVFSIIVSFISIIQPEAYNLSSGFNSDVSQASNYIYYTFVTLTTLGYGDIVPQISVTKSLAILISITGQIYIAIIIAMLVGKLASKK